MELKVQYSQQAEIMLANMPDFDKEAFEKWWWEQQRVVGSNNILEFLMTKKI